MAYTFTIGICSHNRHTLLKTAIDSAIRQKLNSGTFEIIVVDNSDHYDQAIKTKAAYANIPNLRYIISEQIGLSYARNTCIEMSNATYIAFMDDDALAEENWLEHLYRTFTDNAQNRCAVVGGKVTPNWEVSPPEWLLPPDIDHQNICNHTYPIVGNYSVVNWSPETRPIKQGEWLAGANLAFQREILIKAGGFNTALGRKGEGLALVSNEEGACTREIQHMGYTAYYTPNAVVSHFIPKERLTQEWLLRRLSWQVVSNFIDQENTEPLSATEIKKRLSNMVNFKSHTELQNMDAKTFRDQLLAYVALTEVLLTGDIQHLNHFINNRESI